MSLRPAWAIKQNPVEKNILIVVVLGIARYLCSFKWKIKVIFKYFENYNVRAKLDLFFMVSNDLLVKIMCR